MDLIIIPFWWICDSNTENRLNFLILFLNKSIFCQKGLTKKRLPKKYFCHPESHQKPDQTFD